MSRRPAVADHIRRGLDAFMHGILFGFTAYLAGWAIWHLWQWVLTELPLNFGV